MPLMRQSKYKSISSLWKSISISSWMILNLQGNNKFCPQNVPKVDVRCRMPLEILIQEIFLAKEIGEINISGENP